MAFKLVPADEAEACTNALMTDTEKVASEIAARPPSWQNTVEAFANLHARFANTAYTITFATLVATSQAARDTARKCKQRLEEFELSLFARADLYAALTVVRDSGNVPQGEEERRVLGKYLWDFESNGLALSDDKRGKLTVLKKTIASLCSTFNANVNETKHTANFTEQQLGGLGADYLQSLKRTPEGLYIVSTHYPELFPLLQRAEIEETRQTMEKLANTKCKGVNEDVLAKILQLREEAAQLLGFKSDAEFQLSQKMARTPETVNTFLWNMAKGLETKAKAERDTLLSLKKAEYEKGGKCFDEKLNAWDLRFYMTKMMKRDYDVDEQLIQQYLPLTAVLDGLCGLYQKVLGIRYERIGKPDNLWSDDVIKYSVYDAASAKFLGNFYLDLFPREGKYSHAACFPLQLAYNDGVKSYPTESALVCNFTKPLPTKPSLLRHSEVVTLFHEVGHLMHSLLSRSKYSRLNWTWTAVEQDFLEVPSMMFENFAWDPSVLRTISQHWDTGKPLPDDVIAALVKSRYADAGHQWRRIIAMSLVDMSLHTEAEKNRMNTAELYANSMKSLIWIPMTEGTNPVASWQHLTTGYNAGYYVYACDMFSVFKEKGIYDEGTGEKLRREILEPVAIYPGMDMLVKFLGRQPDPRAFLRAVGALP